MDRKIVWTLAVICFVFLSARSQLGTARGMGGLTFVVNSPADIIDKNKGDGVCATTFETCTLRAAIMEANGFPGWDTIIVPPGVYVITIPGGQNGGNDNSGDMNIDTNMTIIGAGAGQTVFNANQLGRFFIVGADNFEIEGVRISNSYGVAFDISTAPTVIIRDSIISLNNGTALFNRGNLTLKNTIVQDNVSNSNGGGIYNDDFASLTLINSQLLDNAVQGPGNAGGGIYIDDSTVTMTNSIIHNNVGGGVYNSGGEAYIYNSLFTDNINGAIIFVAAIAQIVNTTLTNNSGAIVARNDSIVDIHNSTISGNTHQTIAGGIHIPSTGATVSVWNTIIANNLNINCSMPLISNGGNLESGGTCGFNQPNDLSNTNPILGPLQNNGGPTFTRALLSGSPAIDAAVNVNCPQTDQRGFLRPIDGDGNGIPDCDIGAYELRVFPYQAFLPLLK